MSRDASPPPSSDDSAVGSITSASNNGSDRSHHVTQNGFHPPTTTTTTSATTNNNEVLSRQRPLPATNSITTNPNLSRSPKNYSSQQKTTNSISSASSASQQLFPTKTSGIERVDSDELALAAKYMRSTNVSLISRSIRTVLSCFDDLEVNRFEQKTDYLINFISNGINKCSSSLQRPVSILWPDSYDKMTDGLAILDAFLINTEFREKPVDWMLKRGLTIEPSCRQCKEKMVLKYEKNTVQWQCQRSQACANYFMPVQRPSFFSNYEYIGLDKLLFSVYYWATCIPGEDLYAQMNIEPTVLDSLWRRIQNVCRTALEKSYPRLRLTNYIDNLDQPNVGQTQPIDLVSIKLNDVFIVCAKHPKLNRVRLGLHIPNVSLYNFVDLTESWFAHGAHIRVSESKFLDLRQRRTDLVINLVPRAEMISKDGRFYRDSAFGYLICQLTHVFKDYNTSSLSRETLKLILAELEWREIHGQTPYDAFTNIVNHMAQYGEASDWYSEPSIPVDGEESLSRPENQASQSLDGPEYVFAEKHFYATIDPKDENGKVICRISEPSNPADPPKPDVRLICHFCDNVYESFDFSMHLVAHVEHNRRENERKEYRKKRLIECKHCFKPFKREDIAMHATILRSHYQSVRYGCRICCIRLNDRAQFLQHMRRVHFEHETPYRCPSCPFASSFQRDVFIHFQEEHRHALIMLCPFCLRSFTVLKPGEMTKDRMHLLSKHVYNHLVEHFVVSKNYSCGNCCLCFLDKDGLRKHKQRDHNPLEIRNLDKIKIQPFIVTADEEKYCVKAMPIELFIANKRPNMAVDQVEDAGHTAELWKLQRAKDIGDKDKNHDDGNAGNNNDNNNTSTSLHTGSAHQVSSDAPACANVIASDSDSSSEISESDAESFLTAREDGTILVRGLGEAQNYLAGEKPDFKIAKAKTVSGKPTGPTKNLDQVSGCTSQKLIELLSKLSRADGVLPNQSVILTPQSKPALCCECFEFIAVDHYVATINCRQCNYLTHCPRALTKHKHVHESSGSNK